MATVWLVLGNVSQRMAISWIMHSAKSWPTFSTCWNWKTCQIVVVDINKPRGMTVKCPACQTWIGWAASVRQSFTSSLSYLVTKCALCGSQRWNVALSQHSSRPSEITVQFFSCQGMKWTGLRRYCSSLNPTPPKKKYKSYNSTITFVLLNVSVV